MKRLFPFDAVVAIVLAGLLGACSPNLRTSRLDFGDATGVYTGGNLRLVTERDRRQPSTGSVLPTLCSEPSPDYAAAFNQTATLQAAVEKLGDGKLDLESKETVVPGGGRTAGVLALRDGLYAACQSYANGIIGHDAYALILSQYGSALIELMHEPTSNVAAADATGADAAAIQAAKSKQAAQAALLVSCITEHDPTRIGGERPAPKNPMLTVAYCRSFMSRALVVAATP